MSDTRTVRLYPETIEHIQDATSLSEAAPFAEKARDVLERTEQGVTVRMIRQEALEDVRTVVETVIDDTFDTGGF